LENESLNIFGKKLDDEEEGDTLEGGVTVADLEMSLGWKIFQNLFLF